MQDCFRQGGAGVRRLLDSGMRHVVLAGLLSLAAGGGLAVLVSSASGQGSGLPLFHSSGAVIFNFVPKGSTSEAKSATISNAGEGTLEITGVEVPAWSKSNFSIATDGCTGTALGAGQTCTISVVFHPTAVGTLVGDLVITDARDECDNYITLVGSGTETPAPATAHAADCVVPGPTISVPGKTVTLPGKTVTIKVPTSPPSTTPPPVMDALQIVSPPRCVSGRRIAIHLRTSLADRIVFARAYVGGRLVGTAHGYSVSVVTANLRGKLADRYRVRVVAGTANGKTLSLIPYYATCLARQPKRSSKSQ